jgi:hypothetical protein
MLLTEQKYRADWIRTLANRSERAGEQSAETDPQGADLFSPISIDARI